ncbi:uncharacterized protein LOC115456077 isoform X2 [Manduca sexta]|uniref:Cyclin-dependent kinase 2-interacting protein n=1 Tax=Manduca sexta TaxID=7130 RepID=A0A921YQ86_MANSE|nr:uncharacterized protein LOC115456077 isoform X2 [Manduca sexta]XP_037294524.1 uncharacterized protein LOC115456077 isoform X2 [Manduca sexta]KAG6443806.1 hypothetical protein O3G_MSEX003017 [Manduca sexta]KAG6443807.1 hypothetical protein O3G_MSEX003017 [Manduca sexta]KAG6443808.1 hypothetical protein O3G_MSEX003017 [Manduca sexta]
MMSKTPPKADNYNFVPKEITTPIKDQTGISKTVFSHVSKLHGLLNNWVKLRDKGTKFCKVISSVKLHECENDYYPHQLKPIMDNLVEILESLKDIVDGVAILNDQLKALAQLQPTSQPVIFTWSATQISKTVQNIYKSLLKEYRLKQVVTENVAHCRDEFLIETYVSSWELDPHFNASDEAFLFAEFGLVGVT